MKKIITVLMAFLLLCGCTPAEPEGEKTKIVATLFPQYDFAREIAGEKADVELLMPPGVESHAFEPSPADIIKINKADVFIYTSEYMEPWAERLLAGSDMQGIVLDAAKGINHQKHGGDIDPHIWTNPRNAIKMAENILDALCKADEKNREYYEKNYKAFEEKLKKLDEEFEKTINDAPVKKMVFGTKFSLHYFAQRYSLEHMSAIDSCGHNSEPSAKALKEIIDAVNKEKLPAIFYGELENTKATETVARETGAKMLMFHSCHNVTKDEFERGEGYISLMTDNISALKEGLYND